MSTLSANKVQIVLLEMQPSIVASSRTQPDTAIRRAAAAVKMMADALAIPVLASTVPLGEQAPVLIEELSSLTPHIRSTVGLFDDEQARNVLASNRRNVLAIGGVSSEIAILHAVQGARRARYDVYLLTDCCGGLSDRTESAALRQMEAAGAIASSVTSFFTALVEDMTSRQGRAVMETVGKLWDWDRNDQAPDTTIAIDALFEQMRRAWRKGNADEFAACFAREARFIAFDGTTLIGPKAIATFHAQPFQTYLADSELIFDEIEIRPVGEKLWLVASTGGIKKNGNTQDDLTGASAQTSLVSLADGTARIEAFQNTRVRPIDGAVTADIWREFDRAWFANERQQS